MDKTPKRESKATRQAKLTPAQLHNWRVALPMFEFVTDEEIEDYRNKLKNMTNETNSPEKDQ